MSSHISGIKSHFSKSKQVVKQVEFRGGGGGGGGSGTRHPPTTTSNFDKKIFQVQKVKLEFRGGGGGGGGGLWCQTPPHHHHLKL